MRITILLALMTAACTPEAKTAGIQTGIDAAACVLEHPQDFQDPTKLVADCAGVTLADVSKILAAHHTAMRAETGAP